MAMVARPPPGSYQMALKITWKQVRNMFHLDVACIGIDFVVLNTKGRYLFATYYRKLAQLYDISQYFSR